MKEKHYAIIYEFSNKHTGEYCKYKIHGVYHSLEEARKVFNEKFKEDKDDARNDKTFIVYTDTEDEFDAGEEGFYDENHLLIYIIKVS